MPPPKVVIHAAGAFAHAHSQILTDHGADVSVMLSNPAASYGASQVGPCHDADNFERWRKAIDDCDFIVPYSINWLKTEWGRHAVARRIPTFSPSEEGCKLERERNFARALCNQFDIPFPNSFFAANRLEAERIVATSDLPFVIKNPLCAPGSPIHTIVCETHEETCAWLNHLDYAEGVFLQEYAGANEAGHIALVSNGQVHPLVSNQEYKRAHTGDQGIVATSPLGGIVERDETDKYGLASSLIEPLTPWFKAVGFNGPIQVTAAKHRDEWTVLEYNVRLGVTSGALILRMLENPLETLLATCRNESLAPKFRNELSAGCSITVVANGYPHKRAPGPELPVSVTDVMNCDLWWNEVREENGRLITSGQRLCDINHVASSLDLAVQRCNENAGKVRCSGSYYRTDVGKIKWPPNR